MPCYYTGKKALFGRSHTHHRGVAGGRWKKRAQKTQRIFKPNLIRIRIVENGSVKSVKIAAKVLKRIKKDIADGKQPFLTPAWYYFERKGGSAQKATA
jgi:ribosomal protein L28